MSHYTGPERRSRVRRMIDKTKRIIAREMVIILVLTLIALGFYLAENVCRKNLESVTTELSLWKARQFDGTSYNEYKDKLDSLEKKKRENTWKLSDVKAAKEKMFFWLIWLFPAYLLIRLIIWTIKISHKR